ncbi:YcjF family protein [Jannaschia sp. W003]|uniref:YcjF family protein n=1 Tax=Jannaschia sp. W003 TaxID=2867012 RepID=UPI0021A63B7D|nr:TIGR01620 family protein [Jannaschia sp. W003]UWQ22660.1 TIGR01620 family protein [Jannaschia sp. W003]
MAKQPSRRGAVLIELDPAPAAEARAAAADAPEPDAPASPATAPPVPDAAPAGAPTGRAMQTLATLSARPERGLGRWVLGTFLALLGFALSVAAWDFAASLMAERAWLGWTAIALISAFVVACLAVALRELSALRRLARIDEIHAMAAAATDLAAARRVADRLVSFYAARPDTAWGRERLAERTGDVFDPDAVLALAERELLAPLDAAAAREVEAAARQVALVTAVVPLALADVAAALVSNLRMIRRVALVYGGRGGTLGSWRLARTVFTHLAATGAVAVGDDMIHSVAGGGVLSRVSRRFGEGLVNGALTARVGLAAMEVCRPLPFAALAPPRVSALVGRSMTGLFDRDD